MTQVATDSRHRPCGLAQIAAEYPGARGADALHPATLSRFITKGAMGADGVRRRLKAIRVGRRWLVTPADAEAFFELLGQVPGDDATAEPTPAERLQAIRRAEQELIASGA